MLQITATFSYLFAIVLTYFRLTKVRVILLWLGMWVFGCKMSQFSIHPSSRMISISNSKYSNISFHFVDLRFWALQFSSIIRIFKEFSYARIIPKYSQLWNHSFKYDTSSWMTEKQFFAKQTFHELNSERNTCMSHRLKCEVFIANQSQELSIRKVFKWSIRF